MATPLVKNAPASPKSPVLQPLIYKSVVTIYRIFAIVTLYVVLGGVLAYGFVMGFYASTLLGPRPSSYLPSMTRVSISPKSW